MTNQEMGVWDLVDKSCAMFDATREEVLGRGRTENVAMARMFCYWSVRTFYSPQLSFPEIGQIFERNHATVIYGVQKINKTNAKGLRGKKEAMRALFRLKREKRLDLIERVKRELLEAHFRIEKLLESRSHIAGKGV